MTIKIESGPSGVTISIGNSGVADVSSQGSVTKSGSVGGGAGAAEKTPPSGGSAVPSTSTGGSAPAPGALIIGPIVVSGAALSSTTDADGGSAVPSTSTGGSAVPSTSTGGNGAGTGSGVVVIGPIVIGGSAPASTTSIPVITAPTTKSGTAGPTEAPKS